MRLPRMRLPERYTVSIMFGVLVLITVFVMRDSLSHNIIRMKDASGMFEPKMPTAEEFRKNPEVKTGNPLIDDYGKNNLMAPGENGRGVAFASDEAEKIKEILEKHRVNTRASDMIPLNRMVPDSRFQGTTLTTKMSRQRVTPDIKSQKSSDKFHVNRSTTPPTSKLFSKRITRKKKSQKRYSDKKSLRNIIPTELSVQIEAIPKEFLKHSDKKSLRNNIPTELSVQIEAIPKEFLKHSDTNTGNLSSSSLTSRMDRQKMPTADEFRRSPNVKTGNPLIDNYGHYDPRAIGENGQGVPLSESDRENMKADLEKHHINTRASDMIPLNRVVPDSRFIECRSLTYDHDLPTASIIIPFYNEWPSILLRTVYSIINRTPRHLLQEILLLDDNSTWPELKGQLDEYVKNHFPFGLVKVLRMPGRVGLIKARQIGWKMSKGDVIVIFDSHMEVNIDWLQPMLTQIKKNRKSVALGHLDYILPDDMHYTWHENYITRYGFDWRLIFFETYFRQDQYGPNNQDPKLGTVMVGTAYAMDRKYFGEIGGFDQKMKVWGGENLELAWRVWMCGGQLVHLPCSKVGHIARVQPYKFPEGRRETEMYNYKRIIDVWMDPPHRKFVYDYFPEMEAMDVGDISDRLELKKRLGCKNFTWFLENHWPELNVYDQNALAWGSAQNPPTKMCLDNHQYLFQAPQPLYVDSCHFHYATQGEDRIGNGSVTDPIPSELRPTSYGFTWTKDGLLRTSLQCVVVKELVEGARPVLEDCIIGPHDQWSHTKAGFLQHVTTRLCLGIDENGPIMKTCSPEDPSQQWQFNHYNIDYS